MAEYTRTNWQTGEPITQQRMNNIENGIEQALAMYPEVAGATSTAQSALTQTGTNTADIGELKVAVANLTTAVQDNAQFGVEAMTQIHAATDNNELGYSNLDSRFTAIENDIVKETTKIDGLITEVQNARGVLPGGLVAGTLRDKIDSIDSSIAAIGGGYQTISNDLEQAKGIYNSLNDRFTHVEGQANSLYSEVDAARASNGTLKDHFDNIDNQLTSAKASAAQDHTYNSIDERFEAIETEMVTARGGQANVDARLDIIESNTSALSNDKISTSAIANNLTTTASGRVLDARQGRELNIKKINYDDIQNNLTSTDADKPLSANQGRVLNDKITTATTNYQAADTALETAYRAADTALDTAYKAADAALGSRIDTVTTNLNTIASELSMLDGTAIKDTNTKIDTLEADVRSMATELGMIQNNQIVDTNTRVDSLETRVNAIDNASSGTVASLALRVSTAESDIDALETAISAPNTGLTAKVNNLTSTISNSTTGLSATKAIADEAKTIATQAKNKADTALQPADLTGLTNRVTTLESQDTIVINKSANGSNFNSEGEPINISPLTTTADYLIQDDEGKYFYWRYFGVTDGWQLISGGGSGTGTSSAEVLTALPAASDADVNTDYFIGTESGNYVHYRFIEDTNHTLTPIIISNYVDKTKLNQYRIVLRDIPVSGSTETEKWIYLYKFDYGESSVIDSDETFTDPIWASRQVDAYKLPEGGGGSTGPTTTLKITRITPRAITAAYNSGTRTNLQFFFTDGEGGETYRYSLIVNGRTVIPSSSATEITSGDPANKSTTWPTGNIPYGFYSIDITPYCTTIARDQTVTLRITSESNTGIRADGVWDLSVIDFRLTSTAPETRIVNTNDTVVMPYVPYGAIEKTLHVVMDGTLDSTTHEVLSGTEATVLLPRNITGSDNEYTLPSQAHGAHSIHMFMTTVVNNKTIYSNIIYRKYIWYNENDTSNPIIIASAQSNTDAIEIESYNEITIPYAVYNKSENDYNIQYYLNYGTESELLINTIHANGNVSNVFTYTPVNNTKLVTTQTLSIKVEDVVLTFTLQVKPLLKNVAPVSGAIIDFDPSLLTNDSLDPLQSWTINGQQCKMSVSDNFNWSNDRNGGGYKEDADGKCFVVKAGTRMTIPYKMFKQTMGSSAVFDTGAEMKIIFKTTAVRSVDAVWFTNTGKVIPQDNKKVGIQLGAHVGWLKTDKASDVTIDISDEYDAWTKYVDYQVGDQVYYSDAVWTCKTAHNSGKKWDIKYWIQNEGTETLSTNSYLYFPYSENDKIELDININQYDNEKDTNFIMSYEDGVPSKAYPYVYGNGGDALYQIENEESDIVIGSDDCDVYIYRLRIYNKSLSTSDILQNFIADGATIDEKISRYDRNCIYWDSTQQIYLPNKTASSTLDPIKLAQCMPDVKILMLDTPVFTTGKKDFVKQSTLRCLQAPKEGEAQSVTDLNNWFFQNGYHAGQGTTSDNYGQSGRNVDFLFECDGVHAPTKQKDLKKINNVYEYIDYQSSVLKGQNASVWDEVSKTWKPATVYDESTGQWVPADYLTEDQLATWSEVIPEVCDDWKGDNCKVQLTESSVPNNYFNLKVNIASSENVNNALFSKRYNDFLPYNSPANALQRAKHGYDSNITVKNCMEFVPAVLFVRENDSDISKHTEFKDCEWHFYALGNIGDSKKSDYTRAYDPDDMNEFTVENSDNNTNNGQFQSGVFMFENHRAIETGYAAWKNTVAYELNAIVVKDGSIYKRTGATQAALEENETYEWVVNDWAVQSYTGWTDSEAPYFAPRTMPNPKAYLYPITKSEWNVKYDNAYLNYKHLTLVTEEFDGDHSFEFRYACRGDYRDGDLINETEGQDDATQEALNHDVFLAFYEWVVTANKEQFRSEARDWFVPEAMEFFYAYTHYYTMMDNRAKNTFWHFAKTGTYHPVPGIRAVPELLHVYEEEVSSGVYEPTHDTVIDTSKTYYTQYAFDMWVYDCDTAAGIDNNGALVFPYGKEDTDYRTEGDPASGYAFNGAGSIFWRRLSDPSNDGGFTDEIRAIMNSTNVRCFNAQDLIDEFDAYQACFPEEIWRLDIERKYIRTFTGESINQSVEEGKQNPRFLSSMMQGRKKYQRRQWIRDQGVYFNSKYRLRDILDNSNTIEFNCTTPAADASEIAVTPNYVLKLVPYQDMYLNITIGNGTYLPPRRAKAGQEYDFDLTEYSSGNFQETRIYVNGANYLSSISNMAPMYPYELDLRALAHLKVLDIGSDNVNYTNTKFTELKLSTNIPLLETINLKNCHSLGTTLNVSTGNNIRNIDITGTNIPGLVLPEYTSIEVLHIPNTITDLSLKGAKRLRDFKVYNTQGVVDYTRLYKLNIDDSDYSADYKEDPSDPLPVDWMAIAKIALPNTNTMYFYNLRSATIGNINELEPFIERKEALEANSYERLVLDGILNVTGTWSQVEKDEYAGQPTSIWPTLNLNTTGTELTKYAVIYKFNDTRNELGEIVPGEEITTLYITDGTTAPDIFANGMLSEMPHRDPTVRENYSFGTIDSLTSQYIPYSGWQLANSNVPLSEAGIPVIRSRTVIETYFNTSPRTYYVRWYLNDKLIKTSTAPIEYGEGYNLEAPTVAEIHAAGQETSSVVIENGRATYSIFKGWDKLPVNINPSSQDEYFDIHATWTTGTEVLADMFDANNLSNLTPAQLLVLSAMDSNLKSTYQIANKIATGTRVSYNMGYDSIEEGTLLVGPGHATRSILRLDAQIDQSFQTSIQPLRADHDEFTLAIDYCFNPNAVYSNNPTYAVLASCYYSNSNENVKNGFGLFYGLKGTITGPRVGFGDMYNQAGQSVNVGNEITAELRNMVVLRHPKNSPTLYIYSGLDTNNSMPATVNVSTINWLNCNSDAYLNLGCLQQASAADPSDGTPNIVANGKGTIYWAKFWDKDLGAGECKQLASWPHEPMTYGITYLNSGRTSSDYRASGVSAPNPSINLATLTVSSHGRLAQSYMTGDSCSWNESALRRICNQRIFQGLPIELQSILCKPSVDYTVATKISDPQQGDSYDLQQSTSRVRDYVYLYSASNVLPNNANENYDKEDYVQSPFPWYDAAHVISYTYSVQDGWQENTYDTTRANYLNIRFPVKAINWGSGNNKLRVFRETTAVLQTNTTISNSIVAATGSVKSGDIYIDLNNKVYIYVANSELAGVQSQPATGKFVDTGRNGGWVAADMYWTRSAIVGGRGMNFAFVNAYGTPDLSNVTSTPTEGCKFSYLLSI